MRKATTLAPTAAPTTAAATAAALLTCSASTLFCLRAGAGSTYVAHTSTEEATKRTKYKKVAVRNE